MREILQVLFMTARSKIMLLWAKIRRLTSPAYLRTRVLSKVREFFSGLLDIKPRHRGDYYSIANWLVSKRLAFALVVALGLVAALYIAISLPEGFLKGESGGVPTYKYRSIPLKFHSGPVKILARDGYVAYDGNVDGGAASGRGKLFAADGSTVYEGQFENNMFNGAGTQYYPSGVPQYIGTFTDNVYNGTGKFFRDNGTLEYDGDFSDGQRSGAGILHDSVGEPVYQGSFLNGEIAYADFLDRPTGEIAQMYTGDAEVYQSSDEYCVVMDEIDAVYSVKDGSNTLENEWKADRLLVLKDSIALEGKTCDNVNALREVLGEPLYFGTAWVNLPETVAWNRLAEENIDLMVRADLTAEEGLEDVFAVSQYDRDFRVYLYTFEKAGVLYTFYFNGAAESNFLMYAMEKAE